jgi:hemerythrin
MFAIDSHSWIHSTSVVMQQHAMLYSLLNALESRFASSEKANRSLVSLLNSLATHMQTHFEFEDSEELFVSLARMDHQLAAPIEQLRTEHHDMLAAVHTMIEQARQAFREDRLPLEAAAEFRKFCQWFVQHEDEERRLLEAACRTEKEAKR